MSATVSVAGIVVCLMLIGGGIGCGTTGSTVLCVIGGIGGVALVVLGCCLIFLNAERNSQISDLVENSGQYAISQFNSRFNTVSFKLKVVKQKKRTGKSTTTYYIPTLTIKYRNALLN